jgi:hypothetical protein
MAPTIHRVPMTRQRYTPGRALGPVRVLVLHATAGTFPGDLNWLRRGGGDPPKQPVSCHAYIDKTGRITQLVDDGDTAWHCGASSWVVDGHRAEGSYKGVGRLNHLAIGVELENRNNGSDPYPAEQYASALWLMRLLVQRYNIPSSQLVRHLDIAPSRKTDPAGFPWSRFLSDVYGVTPDTPIIGPATCSLPQAQRWFSLRPVGEYRRGGEDAVATAILPAYWRVCASVGVDPCLAVAQMAHETAHLTSALSQRRDRHGAPLRNPAGIGVTGAASTTPRPGYVWDSDRNAYRACVGFPSWDVAIQAHIGRLVAYAVKRGTPAQEALVEIALAARPLGRRGFATSLRALGGTWAANKETYGPKIAAIMNEMRSQ